MAENSVMEPELSALKFSIQQAKKVTPQAVSITETPWIQPVFLELVKISTKHTSSPKTNRSAMLLQFRNFTGQGDKVHPHKTIHIQYTPKQHLNSRQPQPFAQIHGTKSEDQWGEPQPYTQAKIKNRQTSTSIPSNQISNPTTYPRTTCTARYHQPPSSFPFETQI